MIFTRQAIDQSLDRLVSRHPELSGLSLERKASPEDLADFMEPVWDIDYKNEVRVTFAKDFLDYNLNGHDCSRVLVAKSGKDICGVFLGFGQTYEYKGRFVDSCLCTGLTTAHDFRRNRAKGFSGGIGQFLWLTQMKDLAESGMAFSSYWLDMRHNQAGGSLKTFGANPDCSADIQPVWFFAKSFDYKKAVRLGRLGLGERMGLKAAMALFSQGKGLGGKSSLVLYTPEMQKQCLEFIRENQPFPGLKRVFSPEEMDRKFTFSKGKIRGVCMLGKTGEKIEALLYGYTNPIISDEAYFEIDGLIFSPGMGYGRKKQFLASCESIMRHELGCFSAVLPQSVVSESPLKYGYIPAEKQAQVINRYGDSAGPGPHPGKLFLELR